VVTLALIIVGWWQFRRGDATGAARGENQAKKECERATEAAAWVSSPEGRLAYELARVGSLHDLATCSGRGIAARDGWCIVQPERGKLFRWRLPGGAGDLCRAPSHKGTRLVPLRFTSVVVGALALRATSRSRWPR